MTNGEYALLIEALQYAAELMTLQINAELPPKGQRMDPDFRADFEVWSARRAAYRRLRAKLLRAERPARSPEASSQEPRMRARLAKAKAAAPASTRCPFAGCRLDDLHDGDHRIPRPSAPIGVLLLVQTLGGWGLSPFCDLDPDGLGHGHGQASGFYQDEAGFGWSLCAECSPKPIAKPAKGLTELAPQPANVIEMRRRS